MSLIQHYMRKLSLTLQTLVIQFQNFLMLRNQNLARPYKGNQNPSRQNIKNQSPEKSHQYTLKTHISQLPKGKILEPAPTSHFTLYLITYALNSYHLLIKPSSQV